MRKVLSFFLAVMLCFATLVPVGVFASGTATVVIESNTAAKVGEKLSLSVSLTTSGDVNSLGISNLEYDAEVLEFIGFTNHDAIDAKASFKTWNKDMKICSVGLGTAETFNNYALCTLEFNVLKAGTTNVTAKATIKKDSDVFDATVTSGAVTAANGFATIAIANNTAAKVGESLSLPISLTTSADVNSIGLSNLEYDAEVLEFVGFANHDAIDAKASFKTWNKDMKICSVGLGTAETFENYALCTLEFNVLKAGTTNVTAKATIKKDSAVFDATVTGGAVTAANGFADITIASKSSAKVGSTISLPVSLTTSAAVNSIGLSNLEYDAEVLEFVGFANHDAIDAKASFKTWNKDMKICSVGLGAAEIFENYALCTLEFNVLKEGTTNVTAKATIKKDSAVFGTTVNAGAVVGVNETVELTWPDANVATAITYGQTVGEAFAGFPKAGTVKIDGVDYAGQFEVTGPDAKPNAGTYEAKLTFKVTADGEHKDRVFDANGYYLVTVNKADYKGTITAANQDAEYTGIAIDYAGELSYNTAEVAPGTITYSADPINVGDYTVTIPFTSLDANYNDPAAVTATLKIKKAVAADIDDIVIDSLDAQSVCEISSVEALMEELGLPEKVTLTFGDSLTEDVAVTWTAKAAEWNVKGADYEFTPAIESENLDLTNVVFKAVAKIKPVVGTLNTEEIVNVTVSKDQALNAITLADLGIPATASLTTESWVSAADATLVWDKTLDDVKAAAADVTETKDAEITLTLSEDTFAEWFYVTVSANASVKITITNKIPATIASFEAPDGVYGTELDTIELTDWTASDGGEDEDATIKITYKGIGDTVYAESETKPTQAGTYEAIATLVSDIYAASQKAEFKIEKLAITYTVADAEKAYGEENPDFTGDVTEGEIVGEDDLGITYTCEATKATTAGTENIAINATAANANYDVTIVPGVLTVAKAVLPAVLPTITGDAKVGSTLTAALDIPGADGINYYWYVGDSESEVADGENYTVVLTDSNKAITVKAIATEETVNYLAGTTDASEAKTVAKFDISNAVTVATTLNPEGTLAVDTVVTATASGIDNIEVLGITYKWYIDDVEVTGEANTYTIEAGKPGILKVVAVPAEDFTGSATLTVGEVGKTMIAGTLTLTKEGEIARGTVITAAFESSNGATEADYDIIWVVGGVAATEPAATYKVTKADHGKTITAKVVAKGAAYTGEVLSADVYTLEPIAPENVVIETTPAGTSIVATFKADANGSEITEFSATITDGAELTETVTVTAVDGAFKYTFEGLSAGTTYTITATAKNGVGVSAETTITALAAYPAEGSGGVRPSTGGNTGTTVKPDDSSSSEANTNVAVESKTETAVVGSKDLAGKETVSATVTTDSGNKVDVTVDVKDKAVDSLKVTADKAEAEVAGKAAEGLVGEAIEVKVDAKSGKDAVQVGVTVAIDSKEAAYAYAVDELGNTVRLESTYDAETGKVIIENVADGTIVAVSTTAPVDFADVEGRWSEAEVGKAADLGIVSGRGEGSYVPSALLTRSETNKIKKNLAEVLKLALTVDETVKIDTAPDHWAYESDLWAAQTGITTGTGVTEDGAVIIAGDANVVRQDYITLIARMIKLALGEVAVDGEAVQFADAADVADYAQDAFALLSKAGILKGSAGANGVVANPKANITREEAAALSNRAYEFVKGIKTAK